MAVTTTGGPAPAVPPGGTGGPVAVAEPARQGVRPVTPALFVRLKLRVMANSFRGQAWRIGLFVGGGLVGLFFAGLGFLLFAATGLADDIGIARLAAAFGGAGLVLGWLLLPLVFFGVDETLDPARFALLPLPRRTLVGGLFMAALVGVPALALLVATSGLVVSAGLHGGWFAALVAAVGVVAGLLLCVAVSRAVTSAFATMLRSRRVRDLAAVLLAVLAALLGPLQIALIGAAENTDWQRFTGAAEIIGWTPFGAPYTMGLDVADGRLWAVPVKLALLAVTLSLLLWWWSRSLESAMVGAVSGGPARAAKGEPGQAVDQLFPASLRWMPRTRFGALVAREARYWWRDARRRSNLITVAIVGIFVPAMINFTSFEFNGDVSGLTASPTTVGLSMLFVGMLAAVTLANQFGFDGSAYAANVVAGVPGRVELQARVAAFSLYIVPFLTLVTVGFGFVLGEPAWIGVIGGTVAAAYGTGLAVNLGISVAGAYALPETSNPFAINTGAGIAKSMLSLVAMVGSAALGLPMIIATALLPDFWLWLALPVGVAYGYGAVALGTYITGDMLDRRMPELLQTVTPRR
ncbi:ABC transporter permease [Polymorphospora rubra]